MIWISTISAAWISRAIWDIPKIVYTNYSTPEAVARALRTEPGRPDAAVDFVEKQKGLNVCAVPFAVRCPKNQRTAILTPDAEAPAPTGTTIHQQATGSANVTQIASAENVTILNFPDLTIVDVAKKADASIVSLAQILGNVPGIPAETRQEVLRLLEEKNYRPDLVAQARREETPPQVFMSYSRGDWAQFAEPPCACWSGRASSSG